MRRTFIGLFLLVIMLGLIAMPRRSRSQTATAHGVLVTWVASTSSGVTGYNVYRATSSAGVCGTYAQVNAAAVTGTSWNDPTTNLSLSQPYCYVVQTVAGANESGPSTTATVTTPAAWPSNPNPPASCSATVQ